MEMSHTEGHTHHANRAGKNNFRRCFEYLCVTIKKMRDRNCNNGVSLRCGPVGLVEAKVSKGL